LPETVSPYLAAWSAFFTMTASSAAALTGLMFVVVTLVSGSERVRRSPDGISTYSTPTILHFSSALIASAILSAPWHVLAHAAIVPGAFGLYGIIYMFRATYRSLQLQEYKPDIEDLTWFSIVPFVAYGALLGGAIALPNVPTEALFVLGTGILMLIVLGIHNSWDIVTFIATGRADEPPK
jgi:hypothetical protein